MEIKNKKLYIDGKAIGNEEKLLSIFEKAQKWDEFEASFKDGE